MKQDVKQKNDNGLVTGMPVQRGKIISAIVLVSIMGILWLRVFLSNSKSNANAKTKPDTTAAKDVQDNVEKKLQFIDLPVIAGRQNVLNRDVFSISESSIKLETKTEKPVDIKVPLRNEEDIIRNIIEGLTIDAIFVGSEDKVSEAYIEGKVLTVDSIYKVEHGGESYRLTVKEIQDDLIVFEWKNKEYRAVMPGPDSAN